MPGPALVELEAGEFKMGGDGSANADAPAASSRNRELHLQFIGLGENVARMPGLSKGSCPVRNKIRQQLQVLRDATLLIHVSSGLWRLP